METKICSKCNQTKSITEFHKLKSGKFGVRSVCKECRQIEKEDYTNRPEIKQLAKERYQLNKENIKERLKAYYWTLTSQYHGYKKSAKLRGHDFTITKDEAAEFYDTSCYYCGNEFKGLAIDRIDNSLGYTISNCRPCCKWCNYSKRERSEEEFLTHINLIYNNMINKYVSKSV